LALVNVGQVLQNAAVFNFSRRRTNESFMNSADIPAEVEALFDLLEARAVEYLLVGGVAMLAHVRGRNTEDVDLIVSLADQHRLQPLVRVEERDSFFARAFFGQVRVDFLQADHPLFAHVVREYSEERRFDFLRAPRTIRCATPPGLIARKLYALPSLYRQGQIDRAKIYEGDIGRLLAAFPDIDVEESLALLLSHGMLRSDVEELRRVIVEQRPRPDRFGK
jgi:hypothetical protein